MCKFVNSMNTLALFYQASSVLDVVN